MKVVCCVWMRRNEENVGVLWDFDEVAADNLLSDFEIQNLKESQTTYNVSSRRFIFYHALRS